MWVVKNAARAHTRRVGKFPAAYEDAGAELRETSKSIHWRRRFIYKCHRGIVRARLVAQIPGNLVRRMSPCRPPNARRKKRRAKWKIAN